MTTNLNEFGLLCIALKEYLQKLGIETETSGFYYLIEETPEKIEIAYDGNITIKKPKGWKQMSNQKKGTHNKCTNPIHIGQMITDQDLEEYEFSRFRCNYKKHKKR